MVDYHRWMTRKENERRARISKQTLMENETMLGRWLHENQPCNDDYFLEERFENFDLYQNEIYEIQHENNSLHTEKYHLTQDIKNKETQLKLMQQDCKIILDDMKKKNGELLIKNADLVKANKKLEKQLNRFKFDFEDQLDKHDKLLQHLNDEVSKRENKEYWLTKKQKENKYLKNEISRLNALDSQCRNRTNQTKQVEGRNQTLQHEIIDLKLERAALRKELNTLNRRCDRMSKGLERSDTSVHTHENGGINSPKTTHKKTSPQPEHNKEDELSRSRLKQQLILCHHEQSLILEKNQEQEDKIALLKEENKKLVQDNQNERSHYKEMTVHLNHEKEKWTQEKQAHYLMIHVLELRIKQAEGNLCLAYEELNNEKSRNARLSQEKTQYANTKMKNELESERKRNTENIAEKLIVMQKRLESERSRNTILSKERNQYKKQVEKLKTAEIDLSHYHAILRQENKHSEDLRIATENIQQLERNMSDLNRSKEDKTGEIVSLNDKVTKFTDTIERKDRNISKLQSELQGKNQQIEDIQGELTLIKETNKRNERLVYDLQIKMSHYKRKLKETSPDLGKLTNTISHLEYEVEGYKNELKMAREKMKHENDTSQQTKQNDLKLSEHAWQKKIDSLNDQIRELTKSKDLDISKLETELRKKCQEIENTMTEVALIKEQNKKNEQLVTDLQIELNQCKDNNSKSKDKDFNLANINNTISILRLQVETYENDLKQTREEKSNATANIQRMERKFSAIKNSEQLLIVERDSLNDKVKELKTILKRKDTEIQKIETKMDELSLIKEENVKFEQLVTGLQIEIKEYKNEKSSHSAEMTRIISNLKCEVERYQSKLKQASEETRKYALQFKTVTDEHENCQTRIASLSKENEKLRSMSLYKGEQMRRLEAIPSQREQELRLALEKARREQREMQHELDDTKTRLSKVMGQKLTDNNPNIADLSDKNRPTKLAERYSELYDNQWTDAFEVVNKQLQDEKSTIDSLIDILMNAAKFCRVEAMKQLEEIQGILLSKKVGSVLPSLVYKNLKDCRKALGDQTGTAVYEKYMEENARRLPRSQHQDVKPFVKECIELCWLMSIQDPPVVIGPQVQHGAKFDTDFYKAYTSSGPLLDYVVWPALCLHEKGPLLSKGIAQGYGGMKTKK